MAPPALPTRQLGTDGPHVTALGFGLMGLSSFYGATESDEERFKVLDAAYEMGETNWDTADMYGDNEELVGKWFARTGKRSEIFLATKFANTTDQDGKHAIRSDPAYVKSACAKSLSHLGIPTIDLYYCHRVDGKTPIEDTVRAMVELKNEGKIKHLGLSEVSSATLRRACKIHHITAVQIEYSPYAMDIESPTIDLLKTCRELGVATVAYSPLGRGMLTGAYNSPDDFEEGDFRKFAPRFSAENFPKNIRLAEQFGEMARKKGCTPGQLCLAWLMAQGEDVVPIPGTKKLKYLKENLGALEVKVSREEEAEIRKAVEGAEVHGERYPAAIMSSKSFLFGDTPELKA